jgi:hypothetical protein
MTGRELVARAENIAIARARRSPFGETHPAEVFRALRPGGVDVAGQMTRFAVAILDAASAVTDPRLTGIPSSVIVVALRTPFARGCAA